MFEGRRDLDHNTFETVLNSMNSEMRVSGCQFEGIAGGAVFVNSSTLSLSNSTFTMNGANEYSGGAVYAKRSTLTINSSTFTSNRANGVGSVILAVFSSVLSLAMKLMKMAVL